jgi:short-subunit dehydrogenase
MLATINKKQFDPWALVTGASSGIGLEFARQIAASGINVVLVARRGNLLEAAGADIARSFGVQYRVVVEDLSVEGFIGSLAAATEDLDIGLIVSNAGSASTGPFVSMQRDLLIRNLRLNTLAHLEIAHYFAEKLSARKSGGLLFLGAMGASAGLPFMASDSGAKAYVNALGEALRVELKPLGVQVSVLAPGATETAVLADFGLTPEMMPMKPMKVDQVVSEGLAGLSRNRSMIVPGRMNRIMNAVVPYSLFRAMMANMLGKSLANKPKETPRSAMVG